MADIARSRIIRERILRMLSRVDRAAIDAGLTTPQVLSGFRASQADASAEDVRGELNDLVNDRLVKRDWDGDLEVHMFRIDTRGREFVKAEFPWSKIDEFTGRKG